MNPNEPQDSNNPSLKQPDSPEALPPAPEQITPSTPAPEPITPDTSVGVAPPETVAVLEVPPVTPTATTAPEADTTSEQTTPEEFPITAPTAEPDTSPTDVRVNVGQDTSPDAMIVTPGGGSVVQPKQVSPPTTTTTTFGASSPEGASKNQRGISKKLLIIIMAILLVVAAGATYVFAFYLPNRPAAVYATAQSRTADALDELVSQAQELATGEYQSATSEANFSYAQDGIAADGTLSMSADESGAFTGNANLNIMGQKLAAEMRGVPAKNSEIPDVYVKVSGVAAYEQYLGASIVDLVNDKWIMIDHTLLNAQASQTEGDSSDSVLPTEAQVADAVAKVQDVTKQYIFGQDGKDAILQYSEFVGAETEGDQNLNHYTVTLQKADLKTYIDELGKALDSSSLNDWSKAQYSDRSMSELLGMDDLQNRVDELDEALTFDLYVDLDTKLIQRLSYTYQNDDESTDTIFISQSYTGGDDYPFSFGYVKAGSASDDGSVNITVTLNQAAKTAKIAVEAKGEGSNEGMKVTGSMETKLSADAVEVEAPASATPVMDLITQAFGGYGVLGEQTDVPNISALNLLGIEE